MIDSSTQKPKRVLIFSLVYYPRHIGGAEIAVKEITDRIQPEEVVFDMVTLDKTGPRVEKIGNVTIYRVGSMTLNRTKIFWKFYKYLFPFTAFIKARDLHKKNHYDLVWSIMANYAGFGAVFFKHHFPKVPFLLTLQEGDPIPYIEKRVRLVWPLFKKIFTKADHVQAISTFLADWAKKMGATCPVEVVSNGVDVRRFKNPASTETVVSGRHELGIKNKKIREELGFKDTDVVLVTTSRLVTKNGVSDVIEALQFLPENVKFLIIGTGALQSFLSLQVTRLALQERVHFVGFVDHADLPQYLHASDIFIRPSLSEGMGNSFVEAMAAGLLVIATPVGGIPDFLKDGETGLFVKVDDPKDIAQKVQRLIADPALKEKIVQNALQMVKEKYDWKIVSAKMQEILTDLK